MRVELQSLPPSPFHPLRDTSVSTPGEGSRRKASAYKSRFVENKNHFGGRIARLRAVDGRSGARLVDLFSTIPLVEKKKKKRERKETRRGLSRFYSARFPSRVPWIRFHSPPLATRHPFSSSFSLFFRVEGRSIDFYRSLLRTAFVPRYFSSEFSSRFEGI